MTACPLASYGKKNPVKKYKLFSIQDREREASLYGNSVHTLLRQIPLGP